MAATCSNIFFAAKNTFCSNFAFLAATALHNAAITREIIQGVSFYTFPNMHAANSCLDCEMRNALQRNQVA
jgi:hypothetical protein